MLFTQKTKSIGNNLLLIFTLSMFFSCQKDLSLENTGAVITPPDLSTKINSSVSGFVTDENDAAVMGATVQFGSSTISTDKYGYFEAKNVQVVKNAAVVTVIKPGYFKGIKTYIAKEGKAAFFRIKLIPKTIVGNINATSGGTVSLANGLSIKLPAGGIINASTNSPYTGTVNVAAFWINPEATDLNKIMPGDLRGIDNNGAMKLLQTFGMAAVELTGASGELLQIVNGQKATLTLSIPSSLLASAPATIPLWYFDEAKGLWKEEVRAVKTGNTYVGDVSHFSFWSHELPGPYVQVDFTLEDMAGNSLPYTEIKIGVVGTNNQYGWGYTDASGYLSAAVTSNAQLFLEVSPLQCSSVYTQTFTTTNVNISLGIVSIPSAFTATVSGTVTDCNNNQVTNGDILISRYGYYRYPVNNGTFNFSILLCGNSNPALLVAEDQAAQQQSIPLQTNLVAGINNIGNLQACNISNAEFINYTIDGTSYSINVPPDTMSNYKQCSNTCELIIIGGQIAGSNTAYMNITWDGIGLNSSQPLNIFVTSQVGNITVPNNLTVLITEYGAIGQFVSGTFTGVFTENSPPNTPHNITCSFRIRRNY